MQYSTKINANSGYKNIQVFTSNGTFTKPSGGVSKVYVEVQGGGGGGGGNNEGGGGGGYASKIYTITGDVTVTVGAGGAGRNNGLPLAGGDSSFDTIIGGGALAQNATNGGIASGGDININGQDGQSGSGGSSHYGYGGRDGSGGVGIGYGAGGGIFVATGYAGTQGIVIVRW
jgi:hypothetical protein